MISSIRKYKILKFFCFLMALNILNFSVDTPDILPEYIPENLAFNDLESVIEVVLEEGFEMENAIAEHDENDEDNSGSNSLKKEIDLSFHVLKLKFVFQKTPSFFSQNSFFVAKYFEQFHQEIVPPPPKA
jgi:hypothetical protein